MKYGGSSARENGRDGEELVWYSDGTIWGWVKPYPPVVHIKIAGKWMFIPLKMVLIGIDS